MKYLNLNTRTASVLIFLSLFSFCLCLLTACKTTRTSEKAVSKSETASVTESRLTFYRTIDSLSKQLNLSVDSISIIFQHPYSKQYASPSSEFPIALTEIKGQSETPTPTNTTPNGSPFVHPTKHTGKASSFAHPKNTVPNGSPIILPQNTTGKGSPFADPIPHKITVYGLHLNENTEEKAIAQTDLKDSVTQVTQSKEVKSATKQSSKPSSTPKYIFYILLMATAIYLIYRLRR